uniref:UDP-N-acetylglucosamine 2-epimerase n=1 Tax=Ignavibacterium album TaxID=591197 RepID=A0A7V2ZJU5_9BACT
MATEKKKILYICGSLNQTTQMHKISSELGEYEAWFTPYYADGFLKFLTKIGILDFTIMGGVFKKRTLAYLKKHNLNIDYEGKLNKYDLVFTCQDLIIPKNIRQSKIILVQEGMVDPETFWSKLVRKFHLPRWAASTSMTGQSDLYDIFCVASEGFRELFIEKGLNPNKLRVTGIPNFDNCAEHLNNDFPHKNFVLVATSDMRETFKYENRKKLIQRALEIADGRKVIFKLHPNENVKKRSAEIKKYAPEALVYYGIPIEPMIANCDILITRYSSVIFVASALGKKVYSDIDEETIRKLTPIQNGGISAKNIAEEARKLLELTPEKSRKDFNEGKFRFYFRKKLAKVRD